MLVNCYILKNLCVQFKIFLNFHNTFDNIRDAEDAQRDLRPLRLHGRELDIEFAQGDRKSKQRQRKLKTEELKMSG